MVFSYLSTSFLVFPGHWDSMEEYTCMIPRDTHDGAFYRAVLALHQDLFSLAQQVGCIIAQPHKRQTGCTLKVYVFESVLIKSHTFWNLSGLEAREILLHLSDYCYYFHFINTSVFFLLPRED